MGELPSGTVTFLFTDVEGSTRLLKQLRDRYGQVLAEHRRILRTAFEEHGGQEIDTQGDAFFVAFRKATDAALAAGAAQRALAGHAWPEGAECRVRMGLHGYQPYCPYTTGTTTQGSGVPPDLAKARALVDASGTRGMKITFWSWGDIGGLGPYAVRLLRSLGYRVSMKTIGGSSYFGAIGDSRARAQIGTVEWITDYPTAGGFFNALFTCASFLPDSPANSNVAEFCDPHIDRQIGRALTAQTANPDAARGLWERIDRQTVDQAPWVPLVNPKEIDVVSKRVGNYQYSPNGYGMLIDQLWVR